MSAHALVALAALALAGCDSLIGLDEITFAAGGAAATTSGTGAAASTGSGAGAGPGAGGGGGACDTACPPTIVVIDDAAASFAMTATEVTFAQYKTLVDAPRGTVEQPPECDENVDFLPRVAWAGEMVPDDCNAGDPKDVFDTNVAAKGDQPVGCVDWCDALAYCRSIGMRLCGARVGGPLPPSTLASAADDAAISEWYAACSANGTQAYPYGDAPDAKACHEPPPKYVPHAVKVLPGCEGGFPDLWDLSGNVEEWEDACDGAGQCLRRGGAARFGAPESTCALRSFDGTGQDASRVPRSTIDSQTGIRCCAER